MPKFVRGTVGDADDNVLLAGAGAQVMEGGRGNDWLYAGFKDGAQDKFRFKPGDGDDEIAYFELGVDKIQLGDASLRQAVWGEDARGNAVLDYGHGLAGEGEGPGGTVTLLGVTLADIRGHSIFDLG